jgi:hypothetical protein
VSVFRLRARDGGTHADRLFRAGRPGRNGVVRLPVRFTTTDITRDGLRLGDNWYPLELENGQPFHWVNTDAEIYPGVFGEHRGELAIEVEPGPSLNGRPCRLQVLDQASRIVARACVRGRKEVRFPVPAVVRGDTVFRLHVEEGGGPIPGDGRVLNFRVYNCRRVPGTVSN